MPNVSDSEIADMVADCHPIKTVVVIPTYDERENVASMSRAVLSIPGVELLFVDDNSPDGTGDLIEELMANEPRIHCLHRAKKEGLGRAYVAGFEAALGLGADRVVQMDCDFSHDPADVPRLLAVDADLVIGSRYVKGGATPGWPFRRRLISRCGGIFIRTVTGMPLRDPTGGFKCWKASALRRIDFATVASAGYSFQLEMNHRAWKAGCVIREVPISFTDRAAGYSKITAGIAKESLKIAWRLRRFSLLFALFVFCGCQSYDVVQRNVFADDDGQVVTVSYGRSERDHVNYFISPGTGKEMEFRSKLVVKAVLPDGDSFTAWQCMNFDSRGTMYKTDNERWILLANGFTCMIYKQTEEDETRYLEVFRGVLCDTADMQVEKDERWREIPRSSREYKKK